MGFNNYQTLPEEAEKKLLWLGEKYAYIYKDSSGKKYRGVLYNLSEEVFKKAALKLKGNKGDIVAGDLVYIIPKCRIPLFKIKNYLKSVSATITTDITLATKIIGHDKAVGSGLSSVLLYVNEVCMASAFTDRAWAKDPVEKEKIAEQRRKQHERLMEECEGVYEIPTIKDTVISPDVIRQGSLSTYNYYGSSHLHNYITPTGALIIYTLMSKNIPVINEDYIFEKIGKPVAIDEGSYNTLYEMLSSSDEANYQVAAELLANCDIEKSLFYIWKLSRKYLWKLSSLTRFKNVRLFVRMSKWDEIGRMTEEEFIRYIYRKELLTKEIFDELLPAAAKYYSHRMDSDLFTITFVPSEKYKEFSTSEHIYKFTKDDPHTEEVEIIDDDEEV